MKVVVDFPAMCEHTCENFRESVENNPIRSWIHVIGEGHVMLSIIADDRKLDETTGVDYVAVWDVEVRSIGTSDIEPLRIRSSIRPSKE
jgi:hypothetical protein